MLRPAILTERKAGVASQMRDDSMFNSAHVYIMESGEVITDHIDLINPDASPALAPLHFLVDHPIGQLVLIGSFVALMGWAFNG